MNAPFIPTSRAALEERNAWHGKSGVSHCSTCDGIGKVASQRISTINDPYPEADCPDCSGEHGPCAVCGFEIPIPGYDCLVCDMVLEIPAHMLRDETAEAIGQSVKQAIAYAAAWHGFVRSAAA